jgi:hypothetical protein
MINLSRDLMKLAVVVAVAAVGIQLSAAADAPATSAAPVTLEPVTSAQASPDAEGFIRRWVLLEPIPSNGQVNESAARATIMADYFANQLQILPRDGESVAVRGANLTWHALDSRRYNINLYHFAHSLNRSSDNMLFWAVTVVNCPQDMPGVRLAAGSNSSSVWWVNGQEVAGVYGDIQTTMDDAVSKRLTLKKGPNVVRCAVVNNRGATDFCARFLDADGKPLQGYTVSVPAGN